MALLFYFIPPYYSDNVIFGIAHNHPQDLSVTAGKHISYACIMSTKLVMAIFQLAGMIESLFFS